MACEMKKKRLGVLCFQRSKLFHEAALSAGGVVLVNYAFLRSFVEGADRLQGGSARLFKVLVDDFFAGIFYVCASAAAKNTVTLAALLVLLIALDSRLDISQKTSSRRYSRLTGRYFT